MLSNNLTLPTLPALAARSTWAIVFAATITNDAQLTWLWTTHSLVPSAIEFSSASNSAAEGAGGVWIALQRDTTNAAASVRVTAAGGRLRVHDADPHGTIVEVTLPSGAQAG